MHTFAVIVAVVGGIVGLVALVNGLGHRRTARRLGAAGWVSCAGVAAAAGRVVRVTGLAECAPGQPPSAPLSDTPAAWCFARVTAERHHRDSDGDRHTETVTIAELTSGPFVVRDGTGAVLVDGGDRLRWHDLPASVDRRTGELPAGLRGAEQEAMDAQLRGYGWSEKWAGRAARVLTSGGGPYDLLERVVPPGTPVVVVGKAGAGPSGAMVGGWLIGGDVLASTESAEEVAADTDNGERNSMLVSGIAFTVALVAVLVRVLL